MEGCSCPPSHQTSSPLTQSEQVSKGHYFCNPDPVTCSIAWNRQDRHAKDGAGSSEPALGRRTCVVPGRGAGGDWGLGAGCSLHCTAALQHCTAGPCCRPVNPAPGADSRLLQPQLGADGAAASAPGAGQQGALPTATHHQLPTATHHPLPTATHHQLPTHCPPTGHLPGHWPPTGHPLPTHRPPTAHPQATYYPPTGHPLPSHWPPTARALARPRPLATGNMSGHLRAPAIWHPLATHCST
jgi:hypothetical protein